MSELHFIKGKLLRHFTTFGIGGPAKYFVEVRSIAEMGEALRAIQRMGERFFVLGKGSNTLFDDRGFDGVVVLNRIDFCHWEYPTVAVGSGYSFSLLGSKTARAGWSGLEFAAGIPGSVGGAVFMNAGADGQETAQAIHSVDAFDVCGKRYRFVRSELNFAYRSSPFQSNGLIIVGATFNLERSLSARNKQVKTIHHRKERQPLQDKSAGCIFRNSPNCSAGALIDQVGLKGANIGGAAISTKHANFLVNKGEATCRDVLELIQMVQNRVKDKTGVELQPEVRYISYSFDCTLTRGDNDLSR